MCDVPLAQDIKPYVAVGPTPYLSVTVHKSTFDMGFILALVVGIVILLGLVVYAIWYAHDQATLKLQPPPILPLTPPNNTPGLVPVGQPYDNSLEVAILSQMETNNLRDCAYECRKNKSCIGIIYPEEHMCTLLTDSIKVYENEELLYRPNQDPILFMKNPWKHIEFTKKIFAAEYKGDIPTQYWLNEEGRGWKQWVVGQLVQLNFYPRMLKINSGLRGIYSLHPFKVEHAPFMWQKGNTSLVVCHDSNTPLVLPPYWKHHLPIYAYYF
jgi:hypothetical protein